MSFDFVHEHWIGPIWKLREALRNQSIDGLLEDEGAITSALSKLAGDTSAPDGTLLARLAFYFQMVKWSKGQFSDSTILEQAVNTLNQSLPSILHDWPAPPGIDESVDIPKAFKKRTWSNGTYLAYDFYHAVKSTSAGVVASERTPILFATDETFCVGDGAIYDLVVEALPGAPGLVTPDWWSMGLLTCTHPQGSQNPIQTNFLHAMQSAIEKGIADNFGHRLRWRVETRDESNRHPSSLSGSSIQAAAACVARAVCDRISTGTTTPLLNPNVAISAEIGEKNQPFEQQTLKIVAGEKSKLSVALRSKLTAVIFSQGQINEMEEGLLNPQQEYEEPTWLSNRSLLVQEVANLGDAYQCLLVTSRHAKQYAQLKVGGDKQPEQIQKLREAKKSDQLGWFDKWDEQPTPAKYKKQTQEA